MSVEAKVLDKFQAEINALVQAVEKHSKKESEHALAKARFRDIQTQFRTWELEFQRPGALVKTGTWGFGFNNTPTVTAETKSLAEIRMRIAGEGIEKAKEFLDAARIAV